MPGINNRRFKFMPYLLKIPQEQMKELFLLREYGGAGTIAEQVRRGIRMWIEEQERKNGCAIHEIAETTKRYRKESRS